MIKALDGLLNKCTYSYINTLQTTEKVQRLPKPYTFRFTTKLLNKTCWLQVPGPPLICGRSWESYLNLWAFHLIYKMRY